MHSDRSGRTAPGTQWLPVAVTLGVIALGLPAPAAGVPQASRGTDIYLVSYSADGRGMQLGDPVAVTDRDGYDNQPSFLPDGGALLYTSNRDGQTDIFRYDIATGTTTQLTHTRPESEYSPTVTPARAGFSVVRVEADSIQRLWEFPLAGGSPRLLLPGIQPVGYHAWGDSVTLGLFVLGTPSTLQLVNRATGASEIIAYAIGRSLHAVPGRRAISFTHRVGPDRLMIKELDLDSRAVRPLIELLEGNEFYAWLPDGSLLMGQGSELYRWTPAAGAGWRAAADLSGSGVRGISRVAVSPQGTWLAVVGER